MGGVPMTTGIFISYRREDAAHAAGRLVDRLEKTYQRDQIFMDIDNIEPGVDFAKALSEKVQGCDVLLAIIGPNWLDVTDDDGHRRLDSPRDFVRIEIETALKRDVRVIPVLVDGAPMPREQQLPEPLRELSRRQAVRLVHEQFAADVDRLAMALEKVIVPRSPAKSVKKVESAAQVRPQLANGTTAQPFSDKWSVVIAGLYAALALPAFIGFGILDVMLRARITNIAVFGILVSGVSWAAWRGKRLTRLEQAFCWFGCAVALFGIPRQFRWEWLSDYLITGPGSANGFALSSILTVLSAGYLTFGSRSRLSRVEVLVYWLGCSMSTAFLFLNLGWPITWIVSAIGISVLAVFVYLHKRRLPP
jgi:hypothetical protein